jgi:hypothetical protein
MTEWVADMKRRQINGDALLADARALLARNASPTPPTPRERTVK